MKCTGRRVDGYRTRSSGELWTMREVSFVRAVPASREGEIAGIARKVQERVRLRRIREEHGEEAGKQEHESESEIDVETVAKEARNRDLAKSLLPVHATLSH